MRETLGERGHDLGRGDEAFTAGSLAQEGQDGSDEVAFAGDRRGLVDL
jgi:hypothetical protein